MGSILGLTRTIRIYEYCTYKGIDKSLALIAYKNANPNILIVAVIYNDYMCAFA